MAQPNNTNAVKNPGKPADSNLNIRVNKADMDRWKLAAQKAGAPFFTEWVVDTLNRKAKKAAR